VLQVHTPSHEAMGSFITFAIVYVCGGLTLLPILFCLLLLHAYLTFPERPPSPSSAPDDVRETSDDGHNIKSDLGTSNLAKQFQRGHESDVAAGYFAVCREYVPGGINGKPPERTTPAGAVIATESPSVYQSMYRSIFDKKQAPTIDPGKGSSKTIRRARNVFFVVLRHGHLMLYDDAEQVEVRHVISLEHHGVSICNGGEEIPEGELWIKRNAIQLSRKPNVEDAVSATKPFFLFSENCSEKEDFYFALLQNQEVKPDALYNPPRPQQYDVKHIITLVQKLHSSEEQLQTRWINALMGRAFLALYKTREIEDFIRRKITKKISRVKKPAFLSGIVLQKIHMGDSAPYITNPRLKDLTVDGDCCTEADIKYSGNFRLEVAATARIDLGSRFKAREVNLVLAVLVKKLEGHGLVKFKPPPSNRVWVTFETMPDMEMAIEPIVSSRQITYSVILRAIESRIREVIAETLVLPNWDDVPFTDTRHQRFRGGIWTCSNDSATSTVHTVIPDEEALDERGEDTAASSTHDSPLQIKDERTLSMPVHSDPSEPGLTARKAAASTQALVDKAENGVSTGSQKRSEPPKAMRSRSFASTAKPLVSMDNANVDSAKHDMKTKQHKDATSAIMAISNRSQPTSPTETPFGSPPEPPSLWENSKTRKSSSSTSSLKINSVPDKMLMDSIPNSPSKSSFAQAHSSTSSRSSTLGFGNDDQYSNSLHSDTRSIDSVEKRQSITAIGTAAKNWGWNVISRAKEQRAQAGHSSDLDREGTPEHPIGRGRPLPPPGQPLPPPERPSSKVSQNGVPKRKPLPPPALPERRQDETKRRPVPAPSLPKRRVQEAVHKTDTAEDGLMVVEAPQSEPASPINENHVELVGLLEMDMNKDEKTLSAKDNTRSASAHESVSSVVESDVRHRSSSHEEDGARSSSWQLAQEAEERSKSMWMENNEHS